MLRVSAPAKVNLVLEVLGRRRDGFHEIRTLLQTVGWYDRLEIEPGQDLEFKCTPYELEGPDNLVWRAAQMLSQVPRKPGGVRINLEKHIPESAGLGGGSSDAAATLQALSRLWGLDPEGSLLKKAAARLGSDVPFFLKGGLAIAWGRGEKVLRLGGCVKGWVIICLPPVGIPLMKTKQAYKMLQESHYSDGSLSARLVNKIKAGKDIDASDIYNVFDLVAEQLYPGINGMRNELERACGCRYHLSGSGPALFALCSNRAEAQSRAFSAKAKGYFAKACALSHGPRLVESTYNP